LGAELHSLVTECDDGIRCTGLHYRVPFRVQYALADRIRGPYVAGGLDVLSGLSFHAGDVGMLSYTGHVRELRLGAGWRVPFPDRVASAFIHLDATLGQYDSLSGKLITDAATFTYDGPIPSDRRALHMGLALAIGGSLGK
jgi:hypothetical protein